MRNLHIISVNHKSHCAKDRIRLNLSVDGWEQLFSTLRYKLGVEGFVHLQTCNRIEIFYDSEKDVSDAVIVHWLALVEQAHDLRPSDFQVIAGQEKCIKHLLELSVGFKSAIFGDDQILSQLKKAFELARKQKSMSTLLERAYQSIMRFHKAVCRQTDFKSHTVSLAYQALKSARLHFGSDQLKTKNVLIIGAGDMAAQVIKYISKFSYNSISITNRTQSKAAQLIGAKDIAMIPYSAIDFSQYELVISCTDQGFYTIDDWSNVEYYIDLSLQSSMISDLVVNHILLHELQEVVHMHDETRKQSIDQVKVILQEKVVEYVDWSVKWGRRSRIVVNF